MLLFVIQGKKISLLFLNWKTQLIKQHIYFLSFKNQSGSYSSQQKISLIPMGNRSGFQIQAKKVRFPTDVEQVYH